MHLRPSEMTIDLSFAPLFPVGPFPFTELLHICTSESKLKTLLNLHIDVFASQSRPKFVLNFVREGKLQKGWTRAEERGCCS